MYEDLGRLLGQGFGTWKRNLNLAVPFILTALFAVLAVIALAAALVYIFGPGITASSEEMTQEELTSLLEAHLLMVVAVSAAFVVLFTLIGAFFTAGAISMAVQALSTGRSTLKAMWSGGRGHVTGIFWLSLTSGIITLTGLAFLLPAALSYGASASQDPRTMSLLAIGILAFIIYALAVALLLAAAPYALVVDDMGAISSIKASLRFFSYNKFDVLVLWLVTIALSAGLQVLGGSYSVSLSSQAQLQPISLVTGLINLLVLAPLTTVWWTRLYMSRMGKLSEVEN